MTIASLADLIPIGMDADRWSASLRPADARRPAVAGAIGDELSSAPIGIIGAVEDYLERADLASRIPTFIQLAERRLHRRLDLSDNETMNHGAEVRSGVRAMPLP